MTCNLSVVTCTHNPRQDYLARVLGGLREQTLDTKKWEYLLIDNASQRPIDDDDLLTLHSGARLIREEELGLTAARLRGIREAKGQVLVFVDDDNVLAPDFLEQAWRIAQSRPDIGAWSGQCFAGFEAEPPEWTRRYWGMLAVREFVRDVWSNLPNLSETMPCGAGLCLRRGVAEHYLALHDSGQRTTMFDRRGKSLMSAGDNDLAACACDIGLGIGLFRDLCLTHLIPSDRLTEEYLSSLAEGIHYSGVLFRALREPVPPAASWARHLANSLRQWRMSPVDRRIFAAVCRSERQAAETLRSLPTLGALNESASVSRRAAA